MLNERDIIEQFRRAMQENGIVVTGDIVPDGKFHRVHVDGDKKKVRNGWYVLHLDGKPSGAYGCNKRYGSDAKFTWSGKGSKPLTLEERRAFRKAMEERKRANEACEREDRAIAASWAAQLWDRASDCTTHPYLERKGVKSYGLRSGAWERNDREHGEIVLVHDNALMVPIRDAKKNIHSLQAIFPNKIYGDRDKDFVKDGAKAGLFYSFGKPQVVDVCGVKRAVIMIGEGYATLASAHEATGHAAIVAFDAGNLSPVARVIRERFPDAAIVMLADNDQWTDKPIKNPGLTRAREAAKAVGGVVALPDFSALSDGKPTDFNDLHMRVGLDSVKATIDAALNPVDGITQAVTEPAAQAARRHPDEDLIGPEKNPYFRILGYNRGSYYLLQRIKQQVTEITKGDMSEIGLIEIAPLNWWELEFPGERSKIDTKQAAEFLIRASERKGIYDPGRTRGRGAWVDDGRILFHHGDFLTVDGVQMGVSDIDSRYVYEADRSMPFMSKTPLSDSDGKFLLDLAKMFRWSKPGSALLIAGFCAIAPMCGALPWRPHCWINGGAGSGKTTVMKDYVQHLLSGIAIFANGNSTEAGLRQELMADALPVLFDEAESNEEGDARRIQSMLSLMRQSSSESPAKTYKGTAGGTSTNYHVRSVFCVSSIQTGLKQQADVERVCVLTLRPKREDADPAATWAAMSEKLHQMKRDTELPSRLFRRSLDLLPTTLENIKVFAKVAAQIFGTQRDGDQYGTLIAGAWSLISRELATEDDARKMIQAHDWSDHRDRAESDEGQLALSSLMEAHVKIKGGIEVTVHELVRAAYGDPTDTVDLPPASANAVLERCGIRVKGDRLMLSNNSNELKWLMSNSTYAADYRGVLLRLEGADRNDNKPVKFSGINSKCITLPLGPLVSREDDVAAF